MEPIDPVDKMAFLKSFLDSALYQRMLESQEYELIDETMAMALQMSGIESPKKLKKKKSAAVEKLYNKQLLDAIDNIIDTKEPQNKVDSVELGFDYDDEDVEISDEVASKIDKEIAKSKARNEITLEISDLRQQIHNVMWWWKGLSITKFKALTPDMLSSIFNACTGITLELDDINKKCKKLCGDTIYRQMASAGELSAHFGLSNLIFDFIACSYFSSTKSTMPHGLAVPSEERINQCRKSGDMENWPENMLRVVHVKPWHMPTCPAVVAPERPTIVAEVMSVFNDGTVEAGLNDVFNPIVLVERLEVDEPLEIGDKIAVKATRWSEYLVNPEYYGLVEPDCPLSTTFELSELDFTFDADIEQFNAEIAHKRKWEKKHWNPISKPDLIRMGKHDLSSAALSYMSTTDSGTLDADYSVAYNDWSTTTSYNYYASLVNDPYTANDYSWNKTQSVFKIKSS